MTDSFKPLRVEETPHPPDYAIDDTLNAIRYEYKKACDKHPFFSNIISTTRPECADADLTGARDALRGEIEVGNVRASTVLRCELAEFYAAYASGHLEWALEELLQVGAVVTRMVDMLSNELDVRSRECEEAARGTKLYEVAGADQMKIRDLSDFFLGEALLSEAYDNPEDRVRDFYRLRDAVHGHNDNTSSNEEVMDHG